MVGYFYGDCCCSCIDKRCFACSAFTISLIQLKIHLLEPLVLLFLSLHYVNLYTGFLQNTMHTI